MTFQLYHFENFFFILSSGLDIKSLPSTCTLVLSRRVKTKMQFSFMRVFSPSLVSIFKVLYVSSITLPVIPFCVGSVDLSTFTFSPINSCLTRLCGVIDICKILSLNFNCRQKYYLGARLTQRFKYKCCFKDYENAKYSPCR